MNKHIAEVDEITKILQEFALTKFPVKALEVRGPVNEGTSYRWRIKSTRFHEVTVVLKTKKPLLGKPRMQAIEVYGTRQDGELAPNLQALRTYFETAELVSV